MLLDKEEFLTFDLLLDRRFDFEFVFKIKLEGTEVILNEDFANGVDV
jgi:hypothetical protein